MTTLLAVAGQRSLLAAITGAVFAVATPYLLSRWGHIALFGQFWIIFALALYLLTLRHPRDWRVAVTWLCALPIVFLTNMYLFAMVGACWMAAFVQRWLDGSVDRWRRLVELASIIAMITVVASVTGILSPDLGSAGSKGFGVFSMNLASPLVPQMSGLIPGLEQYRVGRGSQYEGFAYLGLGTLLLLAVSLPEWLAWIRRRFTRHIALLCVMGCLVAFALSNKVYLGNHLMLNVPLPDRIVHALGSFQSSGRFFWPVGYALIAGGIIFTLRRYRPVTSVGVLTLAACLQLVDVNPLRKMVSESSHQPAASVFNRQMAAALVAESHAVMAFPTFGCANSLWEARLIPRDEWERLFQANMEFQLFAAHDNLPINSVYNARLETDCAAEQAAENQVLRDGTLYVYLREFTPSLQQLGGRALSDVCGTLDWLHYCLLPTAASHQVSN